MNELFVLLFTMSIVASALFGIVLVTKRIFEKEFVKPIYFLFKMILYFYLLPSILIIWLIIKREYGVIIHFIDGEDFQFFRTIKNRDIGMLPNGDEMLSLVVAVWGIGFVISFIVTYIRGKRRLYRLTKYSDIVENGEIFLIKNRMRDELGIKKDVILYQSRFVNAPFITGILQPKIMIPVNEFTDTEWEMILRHELVHLKKKDLIYKALVGVIQSMHWFNPLIHCYMRAFSEICEYICDLKTVVDFNMEERTQYAKLIVSLASEQKGYKQVMAFADRNYNVLERRVYQIMKKRRISKKRTAALVLTMILLVVICPVITYAAANGVVQVQDELVEHELEELRVEIFSEPSKLIEVVKVPDGGMVRVGMVISRGFNNVDLTLSAREEAYSEPLFFTVGTKIMISLAAAKSSDSFRAGVFDEDGRGGYYSSEQGMLSETITIKSDGEYTIYVEGRNTGDNDLHIMGTIRTE